MTDDEKIEEILRRVRKHPEYLPLILAELQAEHPDAQGAHAADE